MGVIYGSDRRGGRNLRMYKPSQEALDLHAADVTAADERGQLLDAARAADVALREAEARYAPVTELHQLAMELDVALTDAMRAAFAAQRAEIGPRGYEDRIFFRQAKAKPAVHALTGEAERLLTLRENHRLNRIPEVPRVPTV
jgi:hypothetical protein